MEMHKTFSWRKWNDFILEKNDLFELSKDIITESPDEARKAKKELQMLMKIEGKLRDRMYKIEQIILQDPTTGNQTLARSIKDSYKKNVTQFMREVISIVKRIK